jgi:hypothetical protein
MYRHGNAILICDCATGRSLQAASAGGTTMSIRRLILLLPAASLAALVQPTSLANAAGEWAIFRAVIGSSAGGLRHTLRVPGMMATRNASRGQIEASAALRGETQSVASSAMARAAVRGETAAAKDGAAEIKDETVAALSRGNNPADELASPKPADELPSPKPAEAPDSPRYSVELFRGVVKVGTLKRSGSWEIKGGEIPVGKVALGAGGVAYICANNADCVETLVQMVWETLRFGAGSPKASSFEE